LLITYLWMLSVRYKNVGWYLQRDIQRTLAFFRRRFKIRQRTLPPPPPRAGRRQRTDLELDSEVPTSRFGNREDGFRQEGEEADRVHTNTRELFLL